MPWIKKPTLLVHREATSPTGRTVWRLTSEAIYRSTVLQQDIHIPCGYLTDLASVPRGIMSWWVAGGFGAEAAVVHDYLCDTRSFSDQPDGPPVRGCATSEQAADVFDEALEEAGVPTWRRRLMVAAVRYFGPQWGGDENA